MDPAPGRVSLWTDKMIRSFKGHKEVQGLVRGGPDPTGVYRQEAILAGKGVRWSSRSRDGRALQRPSVREDWLGGTWDGRTRVLAGRGICGWQGPLLDLGVLLFLEQALKEMGDRTMRRGYTGGLDTQRGARRCQGLKLPHQCPALADRGKCACEGWSEVGTREAEGWPQLKGRMQNSERASRWKWHFSHKLTWWAPSVIPGYQNISKIRKRNWLAQKAQTSQLFIMKILYI